MRRRRHAKQHEATAAARSLEMRAQELLIPIMAGKNRSRLGGLLWLLVAGAGTVFVLQAADLWALQTLSPAEQGVVYLPGAEAAPEVPATMSTAAPVSGTYLPVVETKPDEPPSANGSMRVPNFAIVGDGGELGQLARAVVARYMPAVFGTNRDDVTLVNLPEIVRRLDGQLRWQPGSAQAVLITDEAVVRLIPGSDHAEVNLSPVTLSGMATEENGKLLMSCRALAELLGTEPQWSEERHILSIQPQDKKLNIMALEDIFLLEVSRSQRRMQVHVLGEPVKWYPMCIGRGNNTPVGHFHIQSRCVWPPWRTYEGEYIPSGSPRNPLGARFLGTTARGHERGWTIGMHGTNQPSSIGRRISGGCLRMHNLDAIEIYNNIPIGTRVWIHEEGIYNPSAKH
jgi:hypothetical protein